MTAERPRRVVIVGAGHAGYAAASELRIEGYDGELVLLDEQERLPYQRPPLSKAYLKGALDAEGLLFRPASYYEKERIDLRCGGRAVSISLAEQAVETRAGERVSYDHLVLATGARSRPAPFPVSGVGGVHELRLAADADRLSAALDRAGRLVVLGGGFIGLEIASAAVQRGVEVVVLEGRERLMARALGPTMADYVLRRHRESGLEVRLGAMVAGLDAPDGRVRGVELASGERLDADFLVVGAGIVARTELAESAGLRIEDGIAVDESLRTSDPRVSAIGDCCSFPSSLSGRRVRLESVQNATDQARAVARRLTGDPEPYQAVPWFWSDQGDMKLQMAGLGGPGDREVVCGDMESGRFSVLRFDGDRLVCGESVNAAGHHVSLRALVAHGGDREVVEALRRDGAEADLKGLARMVRAAERSGVS